VFLKVNFQKACVFTAIRNKHIRQKMSAGAEQIRPPFFERSSVFFSASFSSAFFPAPVRLFFVLPAPSLFFRAHPFFVVVFTVFPELKIRPFYLKKKGLMDLWVVGAAVAAEETLAATGTPEVTDNDVPPLSASQADRVHQVKATMAALQATIEGLKAVGAVRSVQCVELALQKEKRKERALVRESPAVADAFWRLRAAEHQDNVARARAIAQQKERKREATKAIADRNAAVAELNKTRRLIKEMESTRASVHAIKTFTLDALGAGSPNAGGPKARNRRWEVLERLARMKAGLSAGQRNDMPWFKEAWDQAMVTQHGTEWAALFSAWVQNVLDDERSNAFSVFVYNETRRVFQGTSALHVPGS
jgi:hypothetical protein